MPKSSMSSCERVSMFLVSAEDNTDLQDYLKAEDKEAILEHLALNWQLTEDDIRNCLSWTLIAEHPDGWWWW